MQTVSVARRLASLTYDAVLLLSVLILASFPYLWFFGEPNSNLVSLWMFRLYLWLIGFALIGYCWQSRGQTLGMKAWKIKLVQTDDNTLPSWQIALSRYCWATVSVLTLGAGFALALLHPHSLTLHDLRSKTHLVRLT